MVDSKAPALTPDPPRRRGRPATFDAERTLVQALGWYWSEGPDGLSVNELCRRIGIAKPALYRAFGGEDGLLAAALERYGELVVAPLLASLERGRPFAEGLEALAAWLGAERILVPDGCLLARARSARRDLGPLTGERIDALRDAQRTAFARWVQRAQARGEAAPGLDAELAGRYLDAQLTGFLMQRAQGVAAAEVAAQARLAFAGLRAR